MACPLTLHKNKWHNQQIHKRSNKIQKASKKYLYVNQQSYEGNDLIYKKKYPYKQRVDRKKFKAQRARKKTWKQLAFDYDDFMVGGKHENFKRICIRPSIARYQSHDISHACDAFYDDEEDQQAGRFSHDTVDAINIDGTVVNIHFYKVSATHFIADECNALFECPPPAASQPPPVPNDSDAPWDWQRHIPRNANEENSELMTAIAVSMSEYDAAQLHQPHVAPAAAGAKTYHHLPTANTSTCVFGSGTRHYPRQMCAIHAFERQLTQEVVQQKNVYDRAVYQAQLVLKTVPKNPAKIAAVAWNNYKGAFVKHARHDRQRVQSTWDRCNEEAEEDELPLTCVLDECVPFFYPLYDTIFAFLGYTALQVSTIKMRLSEPGMFRTPHSSKRGGIRFVSSYMSQKQRQRRRYIDYSKDVMSYIPSSVYYKTDEQNAFYDIGSYTPRDWRRITALNSSRKQHAQPGAAMSRCWCGCNRGVRGGWRMYGALLRDRICVAEREHCWKHNGKVKRSVHKKGWWAFHKRQTEVYGFQTQHGRCGRNPRRP